jgi:hypothetical protein
VTRKHDAWQWNRALEHIHHHSGYRRQSFYLLLSKVISYGATGQPPPRPVARRILHHSQRPAYLGVGMRSQCSDINADHFQELGGHESLAAYIRSVEQQPSSLILIMEYSNCVPEYFCGIQSQEFSTLNAAFGRPEEQTPYSNCSQIELEQGV